MFRNGRSARGEPAELDERFIPRHNLGRPAPVTANYGKAAILLGANPSGSEKLLKIDRDTKDPLVVAVSTIYQGIGSGTGLQTGVRVSGIFGSGGATARVLFDAKPDSNIMLPGSSVDLDVSWDPTYQGTAANSGGKPAQAIQAGLLPTQANVSAVAVSGQTSRGNATKTDYFNVFAAGNWLLECPPFVDKFVLYTALDASYANITTVEFLTASEVAAGPQVVMTYTGAQLLALKNTGAAIIVPGNVSAVRVTTSAGGFDMRLLWMLSL